jgi:hypothetical protein
MITGESAASFINRVGMNLHLDRTDGQWQNRPFIKALLRALGIRWVRSSLNILPGPGGAYAAFLNELDDQDKADAIRSCQFIAAGTTSTQIRQLMSIWGVSYFEGPNELDLTDKAATSWPGNDLASLAQIASAASNWTSISTVASSVSAGDPQAIRSPLYDYANMHDYFGTRPPETTGWGADVYNNGTIYGSEAYNIATAQRAAPGKPVISTESGYATNLGELTEYTQACYLERLLLVGAMNDVKHRFLYSLMDDNENFGLVKLDGTPKLALKGLIGFLNILGEVPDIYVPAPSVAFAQPAMDFTVGNKVVLWKPAQIQDPNTYVTTLPEPLTVSIKMNTIGVTRYYTQTPTFDWCVEENPDLTCLTVTERPSILAFNCGDPITLPMIPSP